jgi:hypothetical protein
MDLGRWGSQRRLLVGLERLEDAGGPPAHEGVEQGYALLGAGSCHQLLHQLLHVVVRRSHAGQSITVGTKFAALRGGRPGRHRLDRVTQPARR